jgi:hypothetical protein
MPLLPLLFCRPQELEGHNNHYHFILPGDMAINATRLLAEVAAEEEHPGKYHVAAHCLQLRVQAKGSRDVANTTAQAT